MSEASGARPVTIVTGAGSGIGLEVSRILAFEGHRLALVGRTESRLLAAGETIGGAEGIDWACLPTDIGDPEAAQAVVGRAVDALGRLDNLVNNAGAAPAIRVQDMTLADITGVFAVNAVGPAVTLAEAMRAIMKTAGGGRIVNVSSVASHDPAPGLGVYGAAKASLNVIAKAARTEAGETGVKVFTVAPGAVETGMLRSIFSTDVLPPDRALKPEQVARVIADCILGRRDDQAGETITVRSP